MEYSLMIIGGLILFIIHKVGQEIIKKIEYTNLYLRLLAEKQYSNEKVIERENYLNMK